MDNLKELLDKASHLCGKPIIGLVSKEAYINNGVGKELKDIIGWNCIVRAEDTCFEFYVAQPPNFGMTKPVQKSCLIGLRPFVSYKIGIEEALEIFEKNVSQRDCGDSFTAIRLMWPLSFDCKEPYWYFRVLKHEFLIGANTGTAHSCISLKELLDMK